MTEIEQLRKAFRSTDYFRVYGHTLANTFTVTDDFVVHVHHKIDKLIITSLGLSVLHFVKGWDYLTNPYIFNVFTDVEVHTGVLEDANVLPPCRSLALNGVLVKDVSFDVKKFCHLLEINCRTHRIGGTFSTVFDNSINLISLYRLPKVNRVSIEGCSTYDVNSGTWKITPKTISHAIDLILNVKRKLVYEDMSLEEGLAELIELFYDNDLERYLGN